MVSESVVSRALSAADKLNAFLRRAVGPNLANLSQREIARRTGFPRSTLGDFLRDPASRSLRTVARVESLLADPRLQVQRPGLRTVKVDAPAFTRESLAALQRPVGATGIAFVYSGEDVSGTKGYNQTVLSDAFDEDPLSASELVPGGTGNIVSIVWYVG